jgi:molybdopterin-binding protein
VTKKFIGFTLGNLNLKIDDNEILVMIGPTGSGKTTVLNLIAGLLEPDNGSILMDGLDITSLPVEARKIGYTFQNPSLFPHLNVYENIIFGLTKKNRKNDNSDLQITRLLNDLGISHLTSRNIQGLSGGEMQKISYVTHFEDDVYALADSVSILQNGVIENTGRLESILANPNPSSFLSNIFSGGNYLEGNVVNSKNGVSTFKVGSHLLETLGDYSVDSKLGILVRPEDIILSKEMVKTSARNVVKAKVTNITKQSNSAVADIHLVVDRFCIRSRITEESRTNLGIKEDDYIFAIFKASSPQVVREEDS